MESIEVTGENVEDAIAKGLEQLGVSPDQVMVEVLEEPSRGLFGIGSREARVRLVLFGGRPAAEEVASEPKQDVVPETKPARQPKSSSVKRAASSKPDSVDESEWDDDVRVGHKVLSELLEKMRVKNFKIDVRRAESSRDEEDAPWLLNISGKNMRSLIGRRGDTLASLQYITRLIASRELQRRANIIIDAGEYKSERSDRLKGLANRMAEQAVRQSRTITLEPMPPNERRIIHLALRHRTDVMTRSVGEGNSRKVTIVPANK